MGGALVGIGGGVGSTAAAAMLLLRSGEVSTAGLPLAHLQIADAVDYSELVPAGWDLNADNLSVAIDRNDIVDYRLRARIATDLSAIKPWPAIQNSDYCRSLAGDNILHANSFRAAIHEIGETLRRFREREKLDEVVVVNLASTERMPDLTRPCFQSLEAFEAAVDANDPTVSTAMLYAYAAIEAGYPYANFTPSSASDIPPLERFAEVRGVPIAGKDGKTGQTFLKTVIAPALRDRALHVDGWYSTNLLGNLDGFVLDDEGSRSAKVASKLSVLDSILGYSVVNHRVDIIYHGPKGDQKEAWDSIDLTGFLGQRMQLKINFLCADSILAAPIVIELIRMLDLAKQTGEKGSFKPLSTFFKSPQGFGGEEVEHDFFIQREMLHRWLSTIESNGRV